MQQNSKFANAEKGTFAIVIQCHAGGGYVRGGYNFMNKYSPKNVTVLDARFYGPIAASKPISLSSIHYEITENYIVFYMNDVNAVEHANEYPIQFKITVT